MLLQKVFQVPVEGELLPDEMMCLILFFAMNSGLSSSKKLLNAEKGKTQDLNTVLYNVCGQ